MNSFLNGEKKGKLLLLILLFSLVLISHQGVAKADEATNIDPTLHYEGAILLTPGSSTTVNAAPGEDWSITIKCLPF